MAHTVTMAVFSNLDNPKVLIITRGHEPAKGQKALPGGYVEEGEKLIDAVERELLEETGLSIDQDEFQFVCNQEIEPGTDHLYTVCIGDDKIKASSDAVDAKWYPLHKVGNLAFHHNDFLNKAKKYIEEYNLSEDIVGISKLISENIKFNNGLII